MDSTEPTASCQQSEYLSEEPTCNHRSFVTLTPLKDLGGGDAEAGASEAGLQMRSGVRTGLLVSHGG